MNGVERIAAERKRQIEIECYDPEHDNQHDDESLALAACYYALPKFYHNNLINLWPNSWDICYANKGNKDRIRDLEKAGALIAAEIDRLIVNK